MKKNLNNFDIIVIGAGSGGLNIAGFMNRIGLKVLLIDKTEANIGGDCLNFGCIPSKALIHVAKQIQAGKNSSQFYIDNLTNRNNSVDIKKVMSYVKEKQSIIREHENAEHFRNLGMTVEIGKAEFKSKKGVVVNGEEFFAKKIVIATGSRPRNLDLPELGNVKKYNNENIFDMNELPKNLVFIGGGPISLEIGQAFSMLGSNVTILHAGSHLLEKEDNEVGEFMQKKLERMGIKIVLNYKNSKIEDETDAVFVGIGRILNIEGLGLEKAGIQLNKEKTKIIVDEYLRTTNKNVLTVGDVAGGFQFTHAAELHAKLIISNFFNFFKKKLNTKNFSWVTYTNPEIATFGMSSNDLDKKKIKYEKIFSNLENDDRAIVDSAEGFIKLYIGTKGKVLGGTLVAPNAGEIVGELILAQTNGLTMSDLFKKVSPYPTAARIIRNTAAKYESKKLTTAAIKLLKLLWAIK